MDIKKLNEELEKALNESTLSEQKDQINFDTFGGGIQVYTEAYAGYVDNSTYITLNGVALGSVDFVGPALDDIRNKKAYYTWKNDTKQKVQEFLKQATDEFDTKVNSFMEQLGYKRV